jgi:hypothetical protein
VLISGAAIAVLAWMAWLLFKAKQFTRFKLMIERELKPKVIAELTAELNQNKSNITPNNDAHIKATIFYWCEYTSRILQAAIAKGIIDEQWLINTGNLRNCQHLFHIEADKLHRE